MEITPGETITLLERVRKYKRGIKLEDDGGELEEVQAADASDVLQMGRCETCLNCKLDDCINCCTNIYRHVMEIKKYCERLRPCIRLVRRRAISITRNKRSRTETSSPKQNDKKMKET